MIRILNDNFEILSTITKYTSIEFERILNDYGTFTVQIPKDYVTTDIAENNIIQHKGNFGIIRYISQSNGYVMVKGHELKSILSQRYVYSNQTGTREAVIKAYVTEAITGTNRSFNKFSVATSQGRGESITNNMEMPRMLNEVISEICAPVEWGWDIAVNDGAMVFDIIVPETKDYTYSERKKNITSYEYVKDNLTSKNVSVNFAIGEGLDLSVSGTTVYIGQGIGYFPDGSSFETSGGVGVQFSTNNISYIYAVKGSTPNTATFKGQTYTEVRNDTLLIGKVNPVVVVGGTTTGKAVKTLSNNTSVTTTYTGTEPSGLARKEVITEASGNDTSIQQTGKTALVENMPSETIDAEIVDVEAYRTEWDLGDYIKFTANVIGGKVTLTKQVTAVTEVFEPNKHTISPTFGAIKESVFRKIIRKGGA